MKCFEVNKARAIYENGGNITEFLRSEWNLTTNSSEIIEIAYDIQAGTYIDHVKSNLIKATEYADELLSHLENHLTPEKNLLDFGTGELTTLSLILSRAKVMPSAVYAFDISWSRLYKGLGFWREQVKQNSVSLFPFVADIKQIPLPSKSIDIIISSHALEPNGESLPSLLIELFRVCKERLVLFEPSYELNSEEGMARMNRLGYIKELESTVKKLGGTVHDVTLIKNTENPLNPTACYVIEPPFDECPHIKTGDLHYTVSGTEYELIEDGDFLLSVDTGLVFPILKDIPVLKENSAILATSLISGLNKSTK